MKIPYNTVYQISTITIYSDTIFSELELVYLKALSYTIDQFNQIDNGDQIFCLNLGNGNFLIGNHFWILYEKCVTKTAELDVTDADVYKSVDNILESTSRNGMATGVLRCLELLSDNYMEVQKRSFEIYCTVYGHPEFAEGSFSSYQEKQQTTECQDNEELEY